MDRNSERWRSIGSGTMGNGIAQVFAQAGYPVVMIDVAPAALDRAAADDPEEPRAAGQEGDDSARTRCR